MTIREGESYVLESASQFKDRLNVTWDEIAEALPPEVQDRALTTENETREDIDLDRVENVTDVHIDVLHQHVQDYGVNQTIIDVLDARDAEYVHHFDGTTHRITELYPLEDD